jgi:hypothetical protein
MVGRYTTQPQRRPGFFKPRSAEALECESQSLRQYMAEREASEKRAREEARAADKKRREEMLDVIAANKAIAKAPDKRKVLYKHGKKIKTRTRRVAQELKLTRTHPRRNRRTSCP